MPPTPAAASGPPGLLPARGAAVVLALCAALLLYHLGAVPLLVRDDGHGPARIASPRHRRTARGARSVGVHRDRHPREGSTWAAAARAGDAGLRGCDPLVAHGHAPRVPREPAAVRGHRRALVPP